MKALSRDQPAPGLVVYQPRRGFRYGMDPFLLCAWALEAGAPRAVVDLGCGSGIMALLMARLGIAAKGFDVRPEWVELAVRSARESGLDVPFECVDVRHLRRPVVDLALLNPPYLVSGHGRPSPDAWKAAARTELNGTLPELITAGAGLSRRLCLVLRADRTAEAVAALTSAGAPLHRRCDIDHSLVLLEGRPGARDATVERVNMRDPQGLWSSRVRGWYRSLGARLT